MKTGHPGGERSGIVFTIIILKWLAVWSVPRPAPMAGRVGMSYQTPPRPWKGETVPPLPRTDEKSAVPGCGTTAPCLRDCSQDCQDPKSLLVSSAPRPCLWETQHGWGSCKGTRGPVGHTRDALTPAAGTVHVHLELNPQEHSAGQDSPLCIPMPR